jgi:hypothetical protein
MEVKVIIKCGWSLQRESQLPPSSQVALFLLPALSTGCTTFSLNLLQLHVVNLCLRPSFHKQFHADEAGFAIDQP